MMVSAHQLQFGDRQGEHLHRMIFFSAAIHVVILLAFFFMPSLPRPKMTFGPVYSVNLVGAPAALTNTPPSAPLAKEITSPSQQKAPTIQKKSEPPESVPIQKVVTQKKAISKDEKSLEEIRNNIKSSAVQKPVPSHPTTEQRANAISPAGSAAMGNLLQQYYTLLWSMIRDKWALPPGIILTDRTLETIVHVRLSRSGELAEITYEKSSGNRYFDESAMRAIRKAVPFPPLPHGIGEDNMELGIRFHSAELQQGGR